MNVTSAYSAAIVLGLSACNSMNQPVTSGGFDPLRPPGAPSPASQPAQSSFVAGQFVRAAIDNTAFFNNRPKGEGDANKLLPRGSSMKVVSISENYVKVELDSGEIGFIPAVMLEDPNAAAQAPINPGEFQVYPPLPGLGEPLPVLDPTGLPPDGAIPTVIDPDAPSSTAPLPTVTPTTDTFAAPPPGQALPPSGGSTPLPPNGEETEAIKPAEAAPPTPAAPAKTE